MILEFYGAECPHCLKMKPLVERLKGEGIKIDSFEVWHNENNSHKMDGYDNGKCGGVPFFINPEKNKWICGEASYEELKALAD